MSVSLDQGDTFDPPIIISEGDSHNIERNNFYNDIVVAYSRDNQVFLSVYTDLLKDIEITSPTETTQLCYGDELEISFVLNGDFDDDTTISAVLSDASGNFENSIELGEINTNTNGTITVTIPLDLPLSDQYRLLLLSETDCIQSLPINLIIDGVILGFVPTLQACEDNNGMANFDLTQYETPIANGQSGLGFSYHLDLDDAVANVNPISDPTNFSTDATTIFVRAFNSSDPGGCFGIRSFDVSVIDFDQITANPVNLEQCDPNGNGVTIFDLTVANDLIVDNPIFSYSYYNSITSAETQASNGLITNPEAYQNTNPFNDIIYVRLDTPEGCFGVAEVNLTATPAQFEAYNTNPEAIEACETDSNGSENFDLTEIEADILNLLDSETTNDLNTDDYTFTYYEDEANAVLEIEDVNLAIQDPLSYQNTEAFNQTIYVRVTPVAPENRQCFIVIPFSIIVNSIGQIPIASQYVICLTNTDELIESVIGTTLPYPPIDTQLDANQYTFQWYRGTEEQVINMPSSVILPSETGSSYLPSEGGTYTVEIEDVINGCSIYVSTEVIVSYPPDGITVERTNALFSDTNTLEISVVGNGSYEFRLDNGAWQNSPVFEDVYIGEHTFYVRDIFNCGTIFQIKVVIDYPPFFTPNNDGQNDFWTIKNLDQNGAIISIFDRYGKLLKQISPSGTGWDGTYNGKLMPTDDYWFTIEYTEPLDNTRRIFKSHFTLKR
jgi:gliding motility-associated-like protein